MDQASPNQLYLPALAEHRKRAAARRAAAFVAGQDNVCGVPCQPITPATFTALYALESRFVCGGEQAAEGDVRNYLWIHSQEFEPGGSRRVKRKRERALLPFLALTRKRWLVVFRVPDIHTYCAAVALAINDIARLVAEAFADAPAASGLGTKPARATLEAQMIDLFAQAYHWTPERTRATPLRQLYQLIRLINHDDNPDAEEAEIIAEHLRKLNTQPQPATNGVPHV